LGEKLFHFAREAGAGNLREQRHAARTASARAVRAMRFEPAGADRVMADRPLRDA
jgi:hypothetical protein